MSRVTMYNINNRIGSLKWLSENHHIATEWYDRMNSRHTKFMNEPYSRNNFKYLLENWLNLDVPTNLAFNKIMDAFDVVCESGNIGDINTFSSAIAETLTPKVRDGMQAMNYIKMKTRRFKTKLSTKIANKIDGNASAASDVANDIQAKLQVKGAVASAPQSQGDKKVEEAVEAAYAKIESALSLQVQCDRILNNHRILSKHLEVDKLFRETSDIELAIDEVCDLVYRFKSPIEVKYNTALESCWYAINKNFGHYDTKQLVNYVTDYFLMRESYVEEDLTNMLSILSETTVFKSDELEDAYKLISGPVTEETILSLDEQMLEIEFESGIRSYTEATNKAQQLIDNFKKDSKKTPEKLKTFITKFFVLSKNNIVDGTPSILNIIRQFVVLSTLAIGPITFCVTLIANYAIKMKLRRKETEKIRNDIKKEKEKVKKKIDNAKSETTKKRLEEYLKTLDDTYKKIDEYYRNLHTDDENYKRDEEEGYDDDDEEFDFDFDFGDDDFNIESALQSDIVNMMILAEAMGSLPEKNLTDDIISCLPNYTIQEIAAITEFACISNDLVNTKKLITAMEEYKDTIYEIPTPRSKTGITSTIVNSIYRLENATSIDYSIIESAILIEAAKEIYDLNANVKSGVVHELNIANTLKLAADKAKKLSVKLSDKEKAMSRTVDSSLNTLRDSTERALRNDNREAIIRGSMLPSASKIIKGAIAAGAVYLVNPAIAVIGVLGAFAANKKLKAKERQLILDDIEVELKMCEKYIRAAEDNNDMKALKQLYTIQKNLERQKQRIKYNMRVNFNQNVPNTASSNDD